MSSSKSRQKPLQLTILSSHTHLTPHPPHPTSHFFLFFSLFIFFIFFLVSLSDLATLATFHHKYCTRDVFCVFGFSILSILADFSLSTNSWKCWNVVLVCPDFVIMHSFIENIGTLAR